MASWLVQKYDLAGTVTLKCGWSPTDTVREIRRLFGPNRLDIAFLDCPKTDDDLARDLLSLANILRRRMPFSCMTRIR